MSNYYQATAITASDIDLTSPERVIGENDTDLRRFTGCPFFMGSGLSKYSNPYYWHDYQKKRKLSGWMSKNYVHLYISERFRRYFTALAGSNASFIFLIGTLCQVGVYGFTFGTIFLNLVAFFAMSYDLQYLLPNEPELAFIGGSYLGYKLCQFMKHRTNTDFGFTFDRPSGKVMVIGKNGVEEFFFKDFVPVLYYSRTTGGAHQPSAYLTHKTNGLSFCISQGSFLDAVLTWNYLLNFMDISQPLPDIPEHEDTRHLDPVTKAYDERTGRDPYYWRKKTIKEIMAIENEDNKKAEAWLRERRAQLASRPYFYSGFSSGFDRPF